MSEIIMPKGYEHLAKRLAQRPDPPADTAEKKLASAAPKTNPGEVNFYPFPDGIWCKFAPVPKRRDLFVVYMNTSDDPKKPNTFQIAVVEQYAFGNLLCESVNLLMNWRQHRQQEQAKMVPPPQCEPRALSDTAP